MLPCPPHCATSRPPCAQVRAQAREERVVVGDPVEGRGREDGVGLHAEVEGRRGRRRAGRRGRPGACAPPRSSRPRRRRRSRGRAAARSISGSVTRPEPQPASMTVSSPCSAQALEDLAPHRLHRRREAVVLGAAPGADLAHFSPRPTQAREEAHDPLPQHREHEPDAVHRLGRLRLDGGARRRRRRGRRRPARRTPPRPRRRPTRRRRRPPPAASRRRRGAPRAPPAPARTSASPAGTERSRASSAWRCPRSSRRARSAPGGR